MKTIKKVEIQPVFVEFIPETLELEFGKVYVSEEYEVAVHLCLCGCGNQSVTSLKKGEWTLTGDKSVISLQPSILNRFCQAHYILTKNIANFV